MNKVKKAVHDWHESDTGQYDMKGKTKIHALSRFFVTLIYILFVISFSAYDLAGLSGMILYLLLIGIWNEISFGKCIKHIWPVLIMVSLVGIANPFFDKSIYCQVNGFTITGGVISMLTLMIKGIFCVTASYCFIITTDMEELCFGLRKLHVPKEIVTLLLLIYRYLIVLLKEVERMSQAHRLRASKQKGIHIRNWGTFAGQLLLRSIDRAELVYESMMLRGYSGEFQGKRFCGSRRLSIAYVLIWGAVLIFLRVIPIFRIAEILF